MKIERTTPGLSTLEYTMARIVGAKAWEIELTDRTSRRIASLARRGEVQALFPDMGGPQSKLAERAELERRSFRWIEPDLGDRDANGDAAGGESLFLFACLLSDNVLLTGSVVLDRDDLVGSVFQDEAEFLKFLEGLARERGVAEERWAMRRLLASLTIQCIVVNRAGRVVIDTRDGAGRGESTGAVNGGLAPSVQALVKRVVGQYLAAPGLRARPYHVSLVDLGSGDSSPLYVVPLAMRDADGRPDFLALLRPLRSEPPSDATLATALSLTPAEAKVVRQVMFGKKVREISKQASLTEQTVRTYMKRIYSKLGVSCQSELVAKVNELSVPIFSGPKGPG